MNVIETERLYLKPFTSEEISLLYALDSSPDVMKYIGNHLKEPIQMEQYNKMISSLNKYYEDYPGMGIWVTCLKESNQAIGWTAFKTLDESRYVEIGYRYLPEFWGKGYATEICKGLIKYGFRQFDINEIVAIARPENLASRRVMEKVGLVYKRMDHYYETDVVFYELTKHNYLEMNPV